MNCVFVASDTFIPLCSALIMKGLFSVFGRALLHFLDPAKFKNKDEFVQNYKNLSSFNESEVSFVYCKLACCLTEI